MIVGIITFHNAINYGAVLQCYALKEFLTKRGHNVQVLNYRNPYVEDYSKIVPLTVVSKEKGLLAKAKCIIKNLILYKKKQKISKVFKAFVSTRLNISSKIISSPNIPSNYDYILFGSDQIWNPKLCGGFDPVFWGQFPKGEAKFVAYAASAGNPSLFSEDDWQRAFSYLKAFDFISVRELVLKQELIQRFSFSVSNTIDPTLLVEPEVFSSIARTPAINNYIFVYNVMNDDYSEEFAAFLAKKIGGVVVIGQAKPRVKSIKKLNDSILLDSASPEEFLGYIKNARIILGNSFHSIALSIAFRKDFYSLDSSKSERVFSLLSQIGLVSRHVKSTDRNIGLESIDYLVVEPKLEQLRKDSIQFVSNSGL